MKNKFLLYLAFFIVSLGFFIIYFDIGEHFPLSFYGFFKKIIPSISAIAEMTKFRNSSELFLILVWIFVIPAWILWGRCRSNFEFDVDKMLNNQPPWTVFLSYIVSFGLLVGSVFIEPTVKDNTGMYSAPIVYGLVNYKYFVVFYGFSLHFMIFAIVSFLFGSPLYLCRKLSSKRNV